MPYGFSHSIGRILVAMLAVGVLGVFSESWADDDDHANAPASVAALDDALAVVQRIHPGRILKVELESEDDGPAAWVYEVKLLTRAGHVLEVKLDAVSLEVVGVEGGRFRDSDDD